MRREISRSGSKPPKGQESLLVALRHWFWSRKPDAGFLLTDFPATLLQAQVLDEWLDARSEALDAVFAGATAPQTLIHYYRIHGLLREETDFTS